MTSAMHRIKPSLFRTFAKPAAELDLSLFDPLRVYSNPELSTEVRPTYIDNFATTPLDPRVLKSMLPFLTDHFGNAAAVSNAFGQYAHTVVEQARDTIRRFVGGQTDGTVLFTSGATESNNLAIRGIAEFWADVGRHIVTTQIEHKSVLEPCRWLERHGYSVTYVPVSKEGMVDPDDVIRSIREDTILVSVMLANNEVGTIQPLKEIGRQTRERGMLFHSDATQGLGKTEFDAQLMFVDLVSLSAHKLYGPKGVGALYVAAPDASNILAPQTMGGYQEWGLRSGTHNVPGIVGLARACELFGQEGAKERQRIRELRDALRSALERTIDGVRINGSLAAAIPGALNLSIAGIRSSALLERIPEIGISSAAACGGKSGESHVLAAMRLPIAQIRSALRFGIGRFNTEEDVEYVTQRVESVVRWIRSQKAFGTA